MKKNNKQKAVVAMSGGVDSSVAAALLKKQGYDVVGVFMQFWFPSPADLSARALAKEEAHPQSGRAEEGQAIKNKSKPDSALAGYVVAQYGENRCCSLQSWNEAQQVARVIGIPIYKVNFGKEFKRVIVDDFLRQYAGGRTPNPCIACNKFIKFDLLLKYAQAVFGADRLATGHYVSIKNYQLRIKNKIQKVYKLFRAADDNKDQTYFLYNLKQSQLKHLLFPLGTYSKDQVRALAKKMKLPVHDKKDSQEICFVGRSHYDFLKKYLRLKPGKIIDCKTKKVLGEHRGLPFYTSGQRSGIGLSGGPWYVAGFDRKKNRLLVTKSSGDSELLSRELFCTSVNWIAGKQAFPLSCQAQIRYHGRPAACQVKKAGRKYQVTFRARQRAIMPGQSVVFYRGDELLGGGIIL